MPTLHRLVGVYDADHTLRGELAYVVGARLGRAHCSLCDITHGLLREKDEWKQCREALPIPFDTFHRDDQPDEVRGAAGGAAPVVVAELDGGSFAVLLDAGQLEACDGSVDGLQSAIEAAAVAHDLAWPA
jgi:hypothetical protein